MLFSLIRLQLFIYMNTQMVTSLHMFQSLVHATHFRAAIIHKSLHVTELPFRSSGKLNTWKTIITDF